MQCYSPLIANGNGSICVPIALVSQLLKIFKVNENTNLNISFNVKINVIVGFKFSKIFLLKTESPFND